MKLEKDMEQKSNHGGARSNAGRKPGSKNKISKATAMTVLEKLYDKTGMVYEDLLIDDFIQARIADPALAHRYHQLLANKLMPDLNAIEIDETSTVESRQVAFLKALESIGTVAQQHDDIGPILPASDSYYK